MERDKRDSERIPILGALRGEITVFQPMLIREISRIGASVETNTPLPINSLHELRLMLGGTAVVVKGRAVHSRISEVDQDVVTYRTGMEFVEPSERVRDAIADFLEAVKMNRSRASSRSPLG